MSTLWLQHSPRSAAIARRRVLAAFDRAGVAGEPAQDAALIASELVGNAVRHAAPLPSGRVAVHWSVDRHGYEISVTDGGRTGPAVTDEATDAGVTDHVPDRTGPIAPRTTGSQDVTGRGLRIVAALADSWGVAATDRTTTVWARTGLRRAG
ncbi:MAG: ATP-binding protein [Actinobacteria bacterium]|nr:ATP-binding protein [Actinomycetota bacterium]